jgi:hypothetical protein
MQLRARELVLKDCCEGGKVVCKKVYYDFGSKLS